MMLPRITQLMREQARFTHYEDGKLWYQILWNGEEDVTSEASGRVYQRQTVSIFDFPIPVDDAGGGKFLSSDRAIAFMRWIRRHLEYLNGALAEGVYDQ